MDETGYLDALQEPMEELGLGHEANTGRFCGHCYARLGRNLPPRPPSLGAKAVTNGGNGKAGRRAETARARRALEERRRDSSGALESRCEVCGSSTEQITPVASVPAAVLALYLAKRRREGLLVNGFAFFGIFLSIVLSAILWFLLPSGWFGRNILPFAVLVVGAYYLARFFGLWIGAVIGYNSGRAIRDRRWNRYLAERAPRT